MGLKRETLARRKVYNITIRYTCARNQSGKRIALSFAATKQEMLLEEAVCEHEQIENPTMQAFPEIALHLSSPNLRTFRQCIRCYLKFERPCKI